MTDGQGTTPNPGATAAPTAPTPQTAPQPTVPVKADLNLPPAPVQPPQNPSWMDGLKDDHKGFLEMKKWTTPEAIIEGYRNLEKLRGVPAERLLQLPEKMDAPGALDSVYDRLGRPKTPQEYKITVHEKHGDKEAAEAFAGLAHKLGLSATQAEAISNWSNEMTDKKMKVMEDKRAASYEEEIKGVQDDWGSNFEKRVSIARQGASLVGEALRNAWKTENPTQALEKLENAIGYRAMMELTHSLGAKLGEHSYVGSDTPGPVAMSKNEAETRMKELAKVKDYWKDFPKNPEKQKEWNRLNFIASGGNSLK